MESFQSQNAFVTFSFVITEIRFCEFIIIKQDFMLCECNYTFNNLYLNILYTFYFELYYFIFIFVGLSVPLFIKICVYIL